jgi:zinc transport system ATP-binding protein
VQLQNKPLVEIKDVSVRYSNGVTALEHITLDVNHKDLLALIGPNGAGKSTLLKVILGLIKPSSGTVKLNLTNQETTQTSKLKLKNPVNNHDLSRNLKHVGYVPQSAQAKDANIPFSVFETVLLGRTPQIGLFHKTTDKDKQKVEEVLKLFGIFDLKDRKIGQLSGGQAQRVFLAKAMASDPTLLLLDEPTSGVDPSSKKEFYQILEQLNREKGITVMLCSHDISAITKFANRVLCINRSQFFCGLNEDFSATSILPKVYDHPVEVMEHDHP